MIKHTQLALHKSNALAATIKKMAFPAVMLLASFKLFMRHHATVSLHISKQLYGRTLTGIISNPSALTQFPISRPTCLKPKPYLTPCHLNFGISKDDPEISVLSMVRRKSKLPKDRQDSTMVYHHLIMASVVSNVASVDIGDIIE